MRMLLKSLLAVAFLGFLSQASNAQERLGRISTKPIVPQISKEVLEHWKRDFFGVPEFWVIEDKKLFLDSIRQSGIEEGTYRLLARSIVSKLPREEQLAVNGFESLATAQGILLVPPKLKKPTP